MTISELYDWAAEHDATNFEIEIEITDYAYRSVSEDNLEIDRYNKIVDVCKQKCD